jgi:hypothetical protein
MTSRANRQLKLPKSTCVRCLLLLFSACPAQCVLEGRTLEAQPQDVTSQPQHETVRVRFRIIDYAGRAIPSADVSLVSWHRTESGFEKEETHQASDNDGFVEFTVQKSERVMLSATAKGYRPYWRWIRINTPKLASRIKLELWASAHN